MNTPQKAPLGNMTDRIEASAAAWVTRRDAGLTFEEERSLKAWLAADPQHVAAFARSGAAWTMLNAPRLAGRGEELLAQAELIESRQRRRRRLRHAVWAATSLAAAATIALLFHPTAPVPTATAASTSTFLIRPDRQILADGSVIELAAGARISVDYSPTGRAVRLVRGQALFNVTKDATRPFVVSAGGVMVRAVGTEFAVRLASDEVAVLVTEGRVAVQPPILDDTSEPAGAEATVVSAGNRLVLPRAPSAAAGSELVVRAMTPSENAAALAWRNLRVEFNATPLGEAVALLNSQNTCQLVLGDRTTARLCVTGVFWTNDPEGFSRLLETSLGVKARLTADGSIMLSQD